jgi:hypothetical protein
MGGIIIGKKKPHHTTPHYPTMGLHFKQFHATYEANFWYASLF